MNSKAFSIITELVELHKTKKILDNKFIELQYDQYDEVNANESTINLCISTRTAVYRRIDFFE